MEVKVITPEAVYKARSLPKTSRALNDAFYDQLDRTRTHAITDVEPRPDMPGRLHVTGAFHLIGDRAHRRRHVQTLTLEMEASEYERLPSGEPGPIRQRRRVDREIIVNQHLWPRWPRLWLVRDPGQDSRVIDGERRFIPDHGYLRAAGIARGDKELSKPRGGVIRVYRDAYDDCDYADVNALIADGWKVAQRQ